METINYQGQQIEVEQIDDINTAYGEGSDTLYRDTEGFYYLERDRTWAEEQPEGGRAREDFYSVHRININAAILWGIASTDRFNTLRQESADCLMETRGGLDDPNPPRYAEIKKARADQSAAAWIEKVLAGTALPVPAKRLTLNEARAAIGEPRLVPDDTATINLTNKQTGEQWDTLEMPRATFDEIERRATAAGQDFATHFAEMVENFLRSQPEPLADDEEEGDDEAVEEANLPERQFSFTFHPTREFVGYSVRIEVHPESMNVVARLADAFGLTPHAFLRSHVNGTLPGQPLRHKRAVKPLAKVMRAEHIAFTCLDESMASRIKRAAEARGMAEGTFIADAVGRDVDCFEECMVVHPQTGHLLCDDDNTLYRQFDWKELAPPIGRENDPQFLLSRGTNSLMGYPKSVEAKLDPFHGDLLRAFERRHGIKAEAYARAIVEWHLEEMYDIGWNGGETEPALAESIRKNGRNNPPLNRDEVADRCRAAGLNPADYPDAGVDEEDEEFATGRRPAGDPADVALLAAAEPEAVEDLPPEQRGEQPPKPPKGKRRSKRAQDGKEGK